ncbi:MAG: hypothetical protein FWF96_05295, partial [Kiritimatiellaeota bacterium]|nr:hypothetical protein [Kiritimatiellota bacterium]
NGGIVQYEDWQCNVNQMFPTNANYLIRDGGKLAISTQRANQDFNGVMRIENGVFEYINTPGGVGKRFTAPDFGLVFNNGGRFHYTHGIDVHALPLMTDVRLEPGTSNQVSFTVTSQHLLASLALSDNPNPWPARPVATRVFEIHKGAGLAPELPEMTVQQVVETAPNADAHLVKTGGGALALERVSGIYHGAATVLDGALLLNAYATQSVVHVMGGNYNTSFTDIASTAGLHPGQAINYYFTTDFANEIRRGWLTSVPVDGHTLNFPVYIKWGGHATQTIIPLDITFFASGPLGWADITVATNGVLGGTGGHGGNVFVRDGGVFRAGTPGQRVSEFFIGGNNGVFGDTLAFTHGGVWQVDVDATENTCSRVHVSGDILLDGGTLEPIFHNTVKRPRGVWDIATYGGDAIGNISAGHGMKVVNDPHNKILRLVSSEPGTLFLVR